MLGSIVVAAVLVWVLVSMNPSRQRGPRLVLHCATVFQPAMDLIVKDYLHEHGVWVEPQYGGSGTLLGGIEISGRGDLFLPADPSYLERAQALELVRMTTPIIALSPVLAVAEGNPLALNSLEDLLGTEVRVGLANPDLAAIGRASHKALQDAGSGMRFP